MRVYHTFPLIAISVLGCQMDTMTGNTSQAISTVTIPIRSFSPSPSLGGKVTSVSDPSSPNYGAVSVFLEKVSSYTNDAVNFQIVSWSPTAPNTILTQVGLNNDPDPSGTTPRDAAYDSGTQLNPVWGFVLNSMAPFHLSFEQTLGFLYKGGGLELVQSILDSHNANVIAIPVVGSNPQIAGWFNAPVESQKFQPMGLEGLCKGGFVFRFLPPGQNVIDRACDELVAAGTIPAKNISFVASIPGQSVLQSVQLGTITAFEFATPLDDFDPPPSGAGFFPALQPLPIPAASQNPGHKGLRFIHFPSWHQPFFLGWIYVNKSQVWDTLSADVQSAIKRAARDAVVESYNSSATLQCGALRKILAYNDGQVQVDLNGNPILVEGKTLSADIKVAQWGNPALDKLKTASEHFLESLKGGATPTPDQADYVRIMNALTAYEHAIHFRWKPTAFPQGCEDLEVND
jgi:hypothetical protein